MQAKVTPDTSESEGFLYFKEIDRLAKDLMNQGILLIKFKLINSPW